MKSNPHGANQFQLDPRQNKCWEYYVSPKSKTFGNALQSAMKAGYEENYAKTITVTEWFLEKVRRLNLLGKAEKVLDETLELNAKDDEGKIDPALHRLKLDAGKFVAERLGKLEGYSTRQEIATEPDTETKEELSALSDEVIKIREAFETKLKQKLAKL